MERTASGLSISSDDSALRLGDGDDAATDSDSDAAAPPGAGGLLSDLAAAALVRAHIAAYRRRLPDSQPERILRALISPRTRAADFPLDDAALRSLFSAANDVFFGSRLAHRVAWDWSHPASARYASHIAGTTALRPCARLGGWETLIVLSAPILRDPRRRYGRRLLISTFVHEMIHSFLFVVCGPAARRAGGHTPGFRQIAALIDDWAGGPECLRLADLRADLDLFRDDAAEPETAYGVAVQPGGPPVHDPQDHQHHHHHHHHHNHHHHHHRHHHNHHHHQDQPQAHGPWQWHRPDDPRARGPHAPDPPGPPYVY